MIMGGIPHYLKEVKAGKSAAQNIDDICFSEGGLLRDEFTSLYPALFEKADRHIEVVRALGKKWKGLTRKEIVAQIGLSEGGNSFWFCLFLLSVREAEKGNALSPH
jgi:hypothetical protein